MCNFKHLSWLLQKERKMQILSKILLLSLSVSVLMGCNNDSKVENITPPIEHEKPKQTIQLLDYTPGQTKGGSSDASTAVQLTGGYILVADDEANVLRVYPEQGGDAVASWDFEVNGPKLEKELDIEASALLADNIVVFTGSHGNKKDGGDAIKERSHLFAVKIHGTGPDTRFEYLNMYSNLEQDLTAWGEQHQLGLSASAAAGQAPERVNGFAIEGMTVSHDQKTLLIGFRAPQLDTSARQKALIAPLNNHQALINGSAAQAEFGQPIMLDLGGRGIRSLAAYKDQQYLIVAGPAIANRNELSEPFALYLWDGQATSKPQLLTNDLQALRKDSHGSIETIVESYEPSSRVHLLLDNGDSIWPGQTSISKDLKDELQKFQGAIVELETAQQDQSIPKLIKSTPLVGTIGVNTDTQIQLWFDEAIQLKAGKINLYQGELLVESFEANSKNIKIDFNRLIIQPSQKLKYQTDYRVTMDAMIQDSQANTVAASEITSFTTAGQPTPLQAGDLLFMGGNAEAPDAIAFILLKDIDGGTEIYFSDRDYSAEKSQFWHRSKDTPASNEGVFRWTADRFIRAGSIITIQTDTEASPIANVGQVLGSPSGIGKEETMFAMVGSQVDNLTDGSAGLVQSTGQFLAAITLGGVTDNDIPAEIAKYHVAFLPAGKADQTNAIYNVDMCGFDRSNLATFSQKLLDVNCWKTSFKSAGAAGWPMVETDSLFKDAIVK